MLCALSESPLSHHFAAIRHLSRKSPSAITMRMTAVRSEMEREEWQFRIVKTASGQKCYLRTSSSPLLSLSVSFETENENDDEEGRTAAQNDRLHTRSLAGRTDDGHIAIRRSAVASPLL